MEDLQQLDVSEYTDQAVDLALTHGPNLILTVITLIVGLWVINRFTDGMAKAFERSGMEPTLRKFLLSLVNIGLKALLFISVASMIGIETTSFIAVLGAAGLAVGLALQGSLSNFAGGVLILLLRPFRVGDFIEAGSNSGTVREIGIFHTILATPDNKIIIIPNGNLSNNAITNFSREATRRVDIVFGISYDDDLKLAKQTLQELIEADERILKDPAPLIVVSALGDSAVDITTRSWVEAANFWPVRFDLIEKGKLGLEGAGITIPYPQRDVHLYQESK